MKFVNQLLERLQQRASTQGPEGAQTPNHKRPPNVSKIIDDALASAGLGRGTTQGGQISAVIDDALARAGLLGPGAAPVTNPVHSDNDAPVAPAFSESGNKSRDSSQGQFLSHTFSGPAGTLAYKLYVPRSYEPDSTSTVPLLVMLHGCTQSPDDFAVGTRMNAQADLHGFLVAYPAQSAKANANTCWNWFRPQDQMRGGGEPALITAMTAQVATDYRVDPNRVFVAGLSAGAAMAVVLGRTYPDVFAAVGAHSGLAYRAASDMGSAFAAMRNGATGDADGRARGGGNLTPTIVFHGDRDHTVSAANGDAIVAQQTRAGGHVRTRESGRGSTGHGYERTTYTDASGRTVVEDWRVQGGGHAWMGGSATGTYTDPHGPDASAEMVRFFLQQVS